MAKIAIQEEVLFGITERNFMQSLEGKIDWNEGGMIHNWRNYVGDKTKLIWESFSFEQKLAIAYDAEQMAIKEDWD